MGAPMAVHYLKALFAPLHDTHKEPIMKKSLAIFGFSLGILTLIVQFSIYIPSYMEAGHSIFAAVIRQYSYFTILTNFTLVLIYTSYLFPKISPVGFLRTPLARASGAAAIALVFLYYHFVLSPIWNPEGLAAVTDTSLHYVLPITYLIWFILYNRSGSMKFWSIPAMLAGPLLYLAYIFVRGAFIGEYPYPAFNMDDLGFVQTMRNSAELLAFLSILSAIFIGIDRFKPQTLHKG